LPRVLQGTGKENLRYINAGTEFARKSEGEGDSKSGDGRMPIHPPPKARARALRAHKQTEIGSIDWLGLWALSLAFCAINLAAIAYFLNGDNTGASCILVGAAALIAVIIRVGGERGEASDRN
jgi:hypothetical protein